MAVTTSIACALLPFFTLTNDQIEYELNTTRKNVCNRLHDDTLQNYFKNIVIDSLPLNDSINCEYYNDDQFLQMSKNVRSQISTFHMNIRKFWTSISLFVVKLGVTLLVTWLLFSPNTLMLMSFPRTMTMVVLLYLRNKSSRYPKEMILG